MRPADHDDPPAPSELDTPTVRIGDSYPGDEAPAPPPRRRPLLWLPIVIFVALLVAAGIVGRFVVASSPPAVAASPSAVDPGRPTLEVPPPTTQPGLATPPARPAEALSGWATQVSAATSIPVVAVEAYGYAQLVLQRDLPQCHLGWTTLAGVGLVETDHGRAGGAQLAPNGRSVPPMVGPVLDGKNGRALVKDTDAGAYDGDSHFDRALGPLHLMPAMWTLYSTDGDNDGIEDPFDLDDSAVSLGRLLCAGGGDLTQLPAWKTALATYHPGDAYEKSVFTAADSYGQRTRSIG